MSAVTTADVASPARRRIVDGQIDMWPANTPERPWIPGARPQLPEPFTIERVDPADGRGGRRPCRHRAAHARRRAPRLCAGGGATDPGRFAIMGRIALDKPDRAARCPTWRDQPGVLGVRLNFPA